MENLSNYINKMAIFGHILVYFQSFSNKHQYNFVNKLMWKNVHSVYGAGIHTHNLQRMSLLPQPLDQGLLRYYILYKVFRTDSWIIYP